MAKNAGSKSRNGGLYVRVKRIFLFSGLLGEILFPPLVQMCSKCTSHKLRNYKLPFLKAWDHGCGSPAKGGPWLATEPAPGTGGEPRRCGAGGQGNCLVCVEESNSRKLLVHSLHFPAEEQSPREDIKFARARRKPWAPSPLLLHHPSRTRLVSGKQ